MNDRRPLLCEQISFCSQSSLSRQEPLSATASNYHAYILIEYPAPFPAKISETRIDGAWLHQINDFAKDRNAKVILIRNSKTSVDHLKIIFVDAVRQTWCSYAFSGHHYKYFSLKLYVEAEDTQWHSAPFFLVCTNGKKDKCCAKFGLPVYQALEQIQKFPVFEASHFGGDRFAGNAILMPYGIYYGRLKPTQAYELSQFTAADKILPENYRGISTLNFARQSAECWLRKHLNNCDLQFAVSFLSQNIQDGHILMKVEAEGRQFLLTLKKKTSENHYLLTCKSAKPEPITRYEVAEFTEF